MRSFPILVDLGWMIGTAAALLLAGRLVRAPSILAYMVAGLILGPLTGVLREHEAIDVFSELGIALLLFLVGLEMSLGRIKDIGAVALSAGLAQVAATTLLGAGLAALLGLPRADALVLGLALAFSSTVVVIKLLDRVGGVGTAHGRLAIGILLVQDLLVALALTVMNGVGGESAPGLAGVGMGLLRSALGMAALGALAAGAIRWPLPRLLERRSSL
jgi:Kef-type K+ transport system membrane component KefB